jgi:hypothetical protein
LLRHSFAEHDVKGGVDDREDGRIDDLPGSNLSAAIMAPLNRSAEHLLGQT